MILNGVDLGASKLVRIARSFAGHAVIIGTVPIGIYETRPMAEAMRDRLSQCFLGPSPKPRGFCLEDIEDQVAKMLAKSPAAVSAVEPSQASAQRRNP
jgi:hypothetical protein